MRFGHRLGLLCALLFLSSLVSAQALPPEVIQGRNWLVAQVRSDGSVIGEDAAIATPLQTRAEVLESLRRLNAAPVALGTLLSSQPPESVVEHLSRQIMAQAASGVPPTMLNKLKSWQNADGGFGGGGKHQSELLDTSFALLALRAAGNSRGSRLPAQLPTWRRTSANSTHPAWVWRRVRVLTWPPICCWHCIPIRLSTRLLRPSMLHAPNCWRSRDSQPMPKRC